jgi:hypothetical protein
VLPVRQEALSRRASGSRQKTFAGLLGAGYSLLDNQAGRLEILGGVRLWSVGTDISFSGGILDGVSRSDGATWVGAMAGLGGLLDHARSLLDWLGACRSRRSRPRLDVAAAIGYRFNDRVSAVAGYRALGVDYSNDDGFVFDVVQQGPILD